MMKIRKRGASWQADLGIVNGRRRQKSFSSKDAAEKFIRHLEVTAARDEPTKKELEEFRRWKRRAREGGFDASAVFLHLADRLHNIWRLFPQRPINDGVDVQDVAASRAVQASIPVQVPAALTKIADELIHIPGRGLSVIYFLCDENGVVIYVGQSISAWTRLGRHERESRIPFHHVWCLPCARLDLDEVELRWIKHLKPKFNTEWPPMLARYDREDS